ncbi:MAG: FAD-dependent oxidoreductase [Gammaproteobacteria bacterium]
MAANADTLNWTPSPSAPATADRAGSDALACGHFDADCSAVVVVGSGPVGMRLVTELNRRAPTCPIIVYGDEPWVPYDRVRLSSLLAGEVTEDQLALPTGYTNPGQVETRYGIRVVSIDTRARTLTDSTGRTQAYAELILATGSSPFVPPIKGIDKEGVFTFRDLDDAQKLSARRTRTRRTVVLGGGLLGLETARAMQRFNTDVVVVEHNPWLMMQQLDETGAALLDAQVRGRKIQTIPGDSVAEVLGDGRVEGVRLRGGTELECDTLIVSAGIRPRMELARAAGIRTHRGIVVDDHLVTSAPHVHAIGECAQHRRQVYGLVGPGWDQAAVLADRLSGGHSEYLGSMTTARLKVMDAEVVNTGETDTEMDVIRARQFVYQAEDEDTGATAYRKLYIERDRIIGALGVASPEAPGWNELPRIQEAIRNKRRVWPWQVRRFRETGQLWGDNAGAAVAHWPESAVVCNCTGVTRGELSHALTTGCTTADDLRDRTGASSVCGSCKPLLAELLGDTSVPAEKGATPLAWASIVSLVIALAFLLVPAIPYPDSVQVDWRWDELWRDALFKQISGYTLLGAGVLLSVISLRKRIRGFSLWDFAWWRVAHVLIGVLTVAVLVAHTGLRLGHELNLALMLSFTGLLIAGAAAGATIGLQHVIAPRTGRQVRKASIWAHILLIWPLPALLGFHILKFYWF